MFICILKIFDTQIIARNKLEAPSQHDSTHGENDGSPFASKKNLVRLP